MVGIGGVVPVNSICGEVVSPYFHKPLVAWVVDISLDGMILVPLPLSVWQQRMMIRRKGLEPIQQDGVAPDETIPQQKLNEGLPEAHWIGW